MIIALRTQQVQTRPTERPEVQYWESVGKAPSLASATAVSPAKTHPFLRLDPDYEPDLENLEKLDQVLNGSSIFSLVTGFRHIFGCDNDTYSPKTVVNVIQNMAELDTLLLPQSLVRTTQDGRVIQKNVSPETMVLLIDYSKIPVKDQSRLNNLINDKPILHSKTGSTHLLFVPIKTNQMDDSSKFKADIIRRQSSLFSRLDQLLNQSGLYEKFVRHCLTYDEHLSLKSSLQSNQFRPPINITIDLDFKAPQAVFKHTVGLGPKGELTFLESKLGAALSAVPPGSDVNIIFSNALTIDKKYLYEWVDKLNEQRCIHQRVWKIDTKCAKTLSLPEDVSVSLNFDTSIKPFGPSLKVMEGNCAHCDTVINSGNFKSHIQTLTYIKQNTTKNQESPRLQYFLTTELGDNIYIESKLSEEEWGKLWHSLKGHETLVLNPRIDKDSIPDFVTKHVVSGKGIPSESSDEEQTLADTVKIVSRFRYMSDSLDQEKQRREEEELRQIESKSNRLIEHEVSGETKSAEGKNSEKAIPNESKSAHRIEAKTAHRIETNIAHRVDSTPGQSVNITRAQNIEANNAKKFDATVTQNIAEKNQKKERPTLYSNISAATTFESLLSTMHPDDDRSEGLFGTEQKSEIVKHLEQGKPFTWIFSGSNQHILENLKTLNCKTPYIMFRGKKLEAKNINILIIKNEDDDSVNLNELMQKLLEKKGFSSRQVPQKLCEQLVDAITEILDFDGIKKPLSFAVLNQVANQLAAEHSFETSNLYFENRYQPLSQRLIHQTLKKALINRYKGLPHIHAKFTDLLDDMFKSVVQKTSKKEQSFLNKIDAFINEDFELKFESEAKWLECRKSIAKKCVNPRATTRFLALYADFVGDKSLSTLIERQKDEEVKKEEELEHLVMAQNMTTLIGRPGAGKTYVANKVGKEIAKQLNGKCYAFECQAGQTEKDIISHPSVKEWKETGGVIVFNEVTIAGASLGIFDSLIDSLEPSIQDGENRHLLPNHRVICTGNPPEMKGRSDIKGLCVYWEPFTELFFLKADQLVAGVFGGYRPKYIKFVNKLYTHLLACPSKTDEVLEVSIRELGSILLRGFRQFQELITITRLGENERIDMFKYCCINAARELFSSTLQLKNLNKLESQLNIPFYPKLNAGFESFFRDFQYAQLRSSEPIFVSDHDRAYVRELYYCLTNRDYVRKYRKGIPFQKGLFVTGSAGIGKDIIATAVLKYMKVSYIVIEDIDLRNYQNICDSIKQSNAEVIVMPEINRLPTEVIEGFNKEFEDKLFLATRNSGKYGRQLASPALMSRVNSNIIPDRSRADLKNLIVFILAHHKNNSEGTYNEIHDYTEEFIEEKNEYKAKKLLTYHMALNHKLKTVYHESLLTPEVVIKASHRLGGNDDIEGIFATSYFFYLKKICANKAAILEFITTLRKEFEAKFGPLPTPPVIIDIPEDSEHVSDDQLSNQTQGQGTSTTARNNAASHRGASHRKGANSASNRGVGNIPGAGSNQRAGTAQSTAKGAPGKQNANQSTNQRATQAGPNSQIPEVQTYVESASTLFQSRKQKKKKNCAPMSKPKKLMWVLGASAMALTGFNFAMSPVDHPSKYPSLPHRLFNYLRGGKTKNDEADDEIVEPSVPVLAHARGSSGLDVDPFKVLPMSFSDDTGKHGLRQSDPQLTMRLIYKTGYGYEDVDHTMINLQEYETIGNDKRTKYIGSYINHPYELDRTTPNDDQILAYGALPNVELDPNHPIYLPDIGNDQLKDIMYSNNAASYHVYKAEYRYVVTANTSVETDIDWLAVVDKQYLTKTPDDVLQEALYAYDVPYSIEPWNKTAERLSNHGMMPAELDEFKTYLEPTNTTGKALWQMVQFFRRESDTYNNYNNVSMVYSGKSQLSCRYRSLGFSLANDATQLLPKSRLSIVDNDVHSYMRLRLPRTNKFPKSINMPDLLKVNLGGKPSNFKLANIHHKMALKSKSNGVGAWFSRNFSIGNHFSNNPFLEILAYFAIEIPIIGIFFLLPGCTDKTRKKMTKNQPPLSLTIAKQMFLVELLAAKTCFNDPTLVDELRRMGHSRFLKFMKQISYIDRPFHRCEQDNVYLQPFLDRTKELILEARKNKDSEGEKELVRYLVENADHSEFCMTLMRDPFFGPYLESLILKTLPKIKIMKLAEYFAEVTTISKELKALINFYLAPMIEGALKTHKLPLDYPSSLCSEVLGRSFQSNKNGHLNPLKYLASEPAYENPAPVPKPYILVLNQYEASGIPSWIKEKVPTFVFHESFANLAHLSSEATMDIETFFKRFPPNPDGFYDDPENGNSWVYEDSFKQLALNQNFREHVLKKVFSKPGDTSQKYFEIAEDILEFLNVPGRNSFDNEVMDQLVQKIRDLEIFSDKSSLKLGLRLLELVTTIKNSFYREDVMCELLKKLPQEQMVNSVKVMSIVKHAHKKIELKFFRNILFTRCFRKNGRQIKDYDKYLKIWSNYFKKFNFTLSVKSG